MLILGFRVRGMFEFKGFQRLGELPFEAIGFQVGSPPGFGLLSLYHRLSRWLIYNVILPILGSWQVDAGSCERCLLKTWGVF